MTKKAIAPAGTVELYQDWRMTLGSAAGGFVFLTEFNSTDLDRETSTAAVTQINTAFDKVFSILQESGMDARSVAELESYHVGLKDHLDTFKAIWAERMSAPYPAWTAIEVAGFASYGLVEK